MLYEIGNKVVHPGYGAGTIVQVAEKQMHGEIHTYYVMQCLEGSMRVLVPTKSAATIGLRAVGKASSLREVLADCSGVPNEDTVVRDFRARSLAIQERLKSGSFREVAEAVQILYHLEAERALSMSDREMCARGENMLASELALATNQELQTARREVEDSLAAGNPKDA
ncbi:MAG: CarD family transcriptional regulator [Anaerolineae bacterium]